MMNKTQFQNYVCTVTCKCYSLINDTTFFFFTCSISSWYWKFISNCMGKYRKCKLCLTVNVGVKKRLVFHSSNATMAQ